MNGSNPAIKVLLLLLTHLAQINSRNFPYRLTQADNIQRQELLQRRCDKYDSDNKNISIHTMSELDLEHLLIDKKHKFLYCYVPKVSDIFHQISPSILSIDRRIPSSFLSQHHPSISLVFFLFLSPKKYHRWDGIFLASLNIAWNCQVNNEIDMEFRELSTIRIHLPYRSAAVEWVNRVS